MRRRRPPQASRTADQIEKLNQLKESGAITVPEYEALKKKAMEA